MRVVPRRKRTVGQTCTTVWSEVASCFSNITLYAKYTSTFLGDTCLLTMKSSKSANYKIWTTGKGNNLHFAATKTSVAGQDAVLNVFPPSQSKENLKSDKENDGNSISDDNTIKNSLISFSYGVTSSLLIATGTACVQVSKQQKRIKSASKYLFKRWSTHFFSKLFFSF